MECNNVGLRQLSSQHVVENPLQYLLLRHEMFGKYLQHIGGPNSLHALPPLIFCATAVSIIYKIIQFRGIKPDFFTKLQWLPLLAIASWMTLVMNFTLGLYYHESLYCFVYKSYQQGEEQKGWKNVIWGTSSNSKSTKKLIEPESAALMFSILISIVELIISQSQLLPWLFTGTASIAENLCRITSTTFKTAYMKMKYIVSTIQVENTDGTLAIGKTQDKEELRTKIKNDKENTDVDLSAIAKSTLDEIINESIPESHSETEFGSSSSKIQLNI